MGCVRILRGGRPCQGRRLEYGVGPMGLTLCPRHVRSYNADRRDLLNRVVEDHGAGLHGDGEDRRQFAEEYVSGEYSLFCGSCRDELAAEDLGVRADQVEEAKSLKYRMEAAFKKEEEIKATFLERWNK